MKIKTLIAICMMVLVVISCKKQYSCECVSTMKDPTTNASMTKTVNQPISEKLKNKQAVSACNQTATQLTEHLYYYADGSLSVSTLCTVK